MNGIGVTSTTNVTQKREWQSWNVLSQKKLVGHKKGRRMLLATSVVHGQVPYSWFSGVKQTLFCWVCQYPWCKYSHFENLKLPTWCHWAQTQEKRQTGSSPACASGPQHTAFGFPVLLKGKQGKSSGKCQEMRQPHWCDQKSSLWLTGWRSGLVSLHNMDRGLHHSIQKIIIPGPSWAH